MTHRITNVRSGSNPAVAAAGCLTAALGRRLALAISMSERLLIDVMHSKPAVPVPARCCRAAVRPCWSFQAASPSLECRRSAKCGCNCPDVCCGWIVLKKSNAGASDAF